MRFLGAQRFLKRKRERPQRKERRRLHRSILLSIVNDNVQQKTHRQLVPSCYCTGPNQHPKRSFDLLRSSQ
eukprot:12917428-Prorocentrum_lima.AAC.1